MGDVKNPVVGVAVWFNEKICKICHVTIISHGHGEVINA